MGAWGIGHFDNDDASDFVCEVAEAKSVAPIAGALSTAATSDYLEAPDAAIALAAAEIVAAASGRGSPDSPDSVTSIVSKLTKTPPAQIIDMARHVTIRVLDESELSDLWKDTDDYDDWRALVKDLADRLS